MLLNNIKYTSENRAYRERFRSGIMTRDYGVVLKCLYCNKEHFTHDAAIKNGYGKFCSIECRSKNKRMENAYQWKGGHYRNDSGYILKYAPEHPKARQDGYILEHRMIVERDRPLICEICKSTNNMHIHHNDENKRNNAIDNLTVLCSSCHIMVTMLLKLNKSPYKNMIRKFVGVTT